MHQKHIQTQICHKTNEAAALGLRVCVVKVSGILVQTPTGNAQRNIADKLGKAPAVPVC